MATYERKPSHHQQLPIYLGVAFATTVGHSALVSLPFEVGAIADGLGLSSAGVGMLETVELVFYALTNVLIAPVIGRFSPRRIARIGVLLVIAAELTSGLNTRLFLFGLSRAVAGIGFGIVFACANVAGAQALVPERAYSIGLGVSILFYAVLPIVLAHSLQLSSLAPAILPPHSGVFLAMAVFVLVMLSTMHFLPNEPTRDRVTAAQLSAGKIDVIPVVASLILMLLFAIGVFSLYTFVERRARMLGMNSKEIGALLSATFAIGMIGTVASTWLGRRCGLTMPLVLALTLQGVCCVGVAMSHTLPTLWVATIVFMAVWYFVYPYIFGLGADTDPVGRLPTALGGAYLVGSSVATSVGGFLVQSGGFLAIGMTACGLCMAAALIALPLTLRIDAHSRRAGTRTMPTA
jgi:predicted MFS family arabinose efflux permease